VNRRVLATVFTVLLLSAIAAPRAEATQVSFELRITPPFDPVFRRPMDLPSICPMLALSLSDYWWVGAGYEALQDYDAILWTSETEGHKPIAMSGIRAGTWYRGGALRDSMTYSVGGLLTFANPVFSINRQPTGINRDTSVVDLGADLTWGHVWQNFRLEFFATPAWSYGRVSSPAIHKDERLNAFTYRVGLALACRFGS
jgi:hypothetical protein